MAELEPVLVGPGAYGSPDPRTSESVMLPISDDPNVTQVARTDEAAQLVPTFEDDEERDAYLDDTTKKDLMEHAKTLEISGASSMNKEELYDAIADAQGDAEAGGEQRTNVTTDVTGVPSAGGEPTIEEARRRGLEVGPEESEEAEAEEEESDEG